MRPRGHWLLGIETHVGRGYFSLSRHETRREALAHARDIHTLRKSEMEALSWEGRVELSLSRARELACIAIELVSCDCGTPEVHDEC